MTTQTFQTALRATRILGVASNKRADVAARALGIDIPEFVASPDKYCHQHGTADPVTFSSKACNVAGVRYTPKWAWSADYRSHFRKSLNGNLSKRALENHLT